MCLPKAPQMPAAAPPPQEVKAPDQADYRKRKGNAPPPATLLTGPGGVANSSLNTGGNTLLGG